MQLGDTVSVYLDAGPSAGGVASTIVDFTTGDGTIVREGALSFEALAAVVPGLTRLQPPPDEKPTGEATSGEAAPATVAENTEN